MRWLRARQPVLVLACLWVLLYFDYSGLARVGILAALLHETGHVAVWLVLTRKPPVLRLSPGGIGLDVQGQQFTKGQALVLAGAGSFVNLILCVVTLGVMQLQASYWGYFFAGANLLMGLFNLLPFGSLDGHRILQAARG